MPDIKTGRIETPAVSLYYTVRGAGPALLILQGGAGNADSSELLANKLADRFTVITYDRRGLSRSTPVQQQDYEIATHADDAAQVIAALSSGPACVFGSSMGALLGLELALRHPASVRNVIAHEPPAYRLLEGKEREEALLSHLALQETFRKEGLPAAMKLMMARSGVDFNDHEPDIPAPQPPADPQAAARRMTDFRHFFTHDVPAVTRYTPDRAGLIAVKDKIIPAVGAGSPATRPVRCTTTLAELLGTATVEFPGGHTGYILRPTGCAAKIAELYRVAPGPVSVSAIL